jgi:hypothetical protein
MAKLLDRRTGFAHRGVATAIDHTADPLTAFFDRQLERCRVKATRGFVRCRQRQLLIASDATDIEKRGYTSGGSRRHVQADGFIEGLADAAIKD